MLEAFRLLWPQALNWVAIVANDEGIHAAISMQKDSSPKSTDKR
jgi:hypothetical protein